MLLRHDRDLGILATDIAHCTVMFCSLSNAGGRNAQTRLVSADVANFQRLHAVYLDFDQAVRESPLYKYQHVGAWYIIICPNAAEMACLEDERGRGVAGRGGELAWHSLGQVT